jgi:Spy/CpxP family protein refolding chaperone
MQKRTILSGAVLLVLFLPAIISAQMRHRGPPKASCLSSDFMSVEGLDLDAEQKEAIEKIGRIYSEQINGFQRDLMRKRLELQSVFRNPQADEQKIRAIAQEVSQLQDQSLTTMIEHQIKVRALLRPEQLQKWCTSQEPCFGKGRCREP